MKPVDMVVPLAAILMGSLSAYSTARWMDGVDQGATKIRKAKADLIASADLFRLHNEVYSKVGPRAWENEVKPRFMASLTYATIRETGKLIPEPGDVVQWVRDHPKEAQRMLSEAAGH